MPLEKKECPANCNETACDAIYKWYADKYQQCVGDITCEAQIQELYAQALETCSVPNGA